MAQFESTTPDAKLVAATLAGDEQAFQEIVRRYSAMVYALAMARLRDHEVAEDVTQEVFLRVYLHRAKLAEPRYLGTWIGRITRNLAEDWRRRSQRSSHLLPTLSMDNSDMVLKEANVKPVTEQMDDARREQLLNEAIRDLPTDQQEIVLLHFAEGWNYREIAEKLEKDPTTVSRTLKRTLEALRAKVGSVIDHPRPVRPSPVRTAAMVAAISALSVEAKASLVVATESIVSASSLPATTTGSSGILAGAVQWFQLLSLGKKIAVVVASATAITGGAVVVEQTIAPSPARASQAVAVVAAAAPTAATAAQWDVNAAGLEGPWVAEMGGGKLVILIHRENDKYAGIVYNGTRARGTLKLIKVSQEGNNVTIQSDNSVVRFDGKRATASTMTGTYYKFGKGSEVTLTREATTPLQPAPPTYKEVAVSPDKLDRFVGTYAANATRGMKITREGNNLQYDDLVYEKYTLYPKSETSFFSKDVDLVVEFASDANGNVTTVIWSEALSNTRWVMRKLNEQQLQRFRTALPRQQNPGAPK